MDLLFGRFFILYHLELYGVIFFPLWVKSTSYRISHRLPFRIGIDIYGMYCMRVWGVMISNSRGVCKMRLPKCNFSSGNFLREGAVAAYGLNGYFDDVT